jgi:YggT family protein
MNLFGLLASLISFYAVVILVYVLLSWVMVAGGRGAVYDVYRALGTVCEPYLGLFRRILPPIMIGGGGVDLSPLIGYIVLQILASLVRSLG